MVHSITFLGTLSKAFSMSTKHIYNFLVLLLIFPLHSPHNEYRIHCSFSWHKSKLHFIQLISVRIRLSSTFSIIFMACSGSFISLYDPQLITSPFPLKIGTFKLFFHSSTIQYTLTQFHHHFNPDFAACNYYLHTYFRWYNCLS